MKHYFPPSGAVTGALSAQPTLKNELRADLAFAFTDDYRFAVDCRQSIDATPCIPTGSVRALDCGDVRLGIDTYWRATP